MWRRARRHPILLSLAALLLLAIAGAAATGWYFLGEGRRAGRLVSTVLTSQTGIPIFVDRATPDGPQRLILHGVRVLPGSHSRGEIRVRELRVDGGLLPIVFPRGRSLSVVAVSTSVTLPPVGGSAVPPTAEDLDALRRLAVEMIRWPGDFSLVVQGGELRAGDEAFRFDLKGGKGGAGALTARLTIEPSTNGLAPSTSGPALAFDLAGGETGGRVNLTTHLTAVPPRLGARWPRSLPTLAQLALDVDLALPPRSPSTSPAGADLELAGRLEAVRGATDAPITGEFAARYRADAGQLDLPRLSLDWGGDLRLAGTGRIEELRVAARLTVEMSGEAMGTRLVGSLGYVTGAGDFMGRVQTEAVDGRRLVDDARRLLNLDGAGAPPVDLTAKQTTSTVTATVGSSEIRLAIRSTMKGVQTRRLFGEAVLDGALGLDGTLRRTRTGTELARLEPSTLTVSRGGTPLAAVTARSGDRTSWPLAIEATVPELQRVPPSPMFPGKYTGRAALTGTLDRAGAGVSFTGQFVADLPRAEIDLGGPIVLTDAKAEVPVTWATSPATSTSTVTGKAPASEPAEVGGASVRASASTGTVFVEQVTGYGFTLARLISTAQFRDGRLLLPDLGYVHYDGRGRGWLEAAIDGRAVPLRARLEGQHIDLARLTREYGLTLAEISGKVHYLFVLQYSPAQGVVVVGQVASDDEGGQVSIEAIETLLASAQVKAEATGVLRQTLENLRVFRYASLSGDVRVTRAGGYVNLSLEGKKRLGIFPAPVRAINLQNLPIGMLTRLFARRDVP